jgi:hypothetical protein
MCRKNNLETVCIGLKVLTEYIITLTKNTSEEYNFVCQNITFLVTPQQNMRMQVTAFIKSTCSTHFCIKVHNKLQQEEKEKKIHFNVFYIKPYFC